MLVPNGSQDFVGSDIERGHPVKIQVDPDSAFATTPDTNLADTINGFKVFLDDVDSVGVELLKRSITLKC